MRSAKTLKMEELDRAFADLETSELLYTVGLVMHGKDIADLGLAHVEKILLRFEEEGIILRGLTQVAETYSFAKFLPDTASPWACPADEELR